jgi:hypothetical protein
MADDIKLTPGAIWRDSVAALRLDFGTLFSLAAPFTLLIDMVTSLFGPPQPQTMADFTPRTVFLLILLPGIIAGIAQLAVAHRIALPAEAPRRALATGFVALPAYVAALLLSAIPTGIGIICFVIPGLYVTARLFVLVPVAACERLGAIALLRRSWALTAGQGWPILWFIVLGLLFILGASLLAAGVGSAFAAVLTLVGAKPVAGFVAALVPALLATGFSIAAAATQTIIYLKLRT